MNTYQKALAEAEGACEMMKMSVHIWDFPPSEVPKDFIKNGDYAIRNYENNSTLFLHLLPF